MPIHSSPKIDVPTNISFSAFTLPKMQKFGAQVAILEDSTGRVLTYVQFVLKVKQLGAALLRQGVQRGDVVTICALNCLEHALLFYAAARIGVVFFGINAEFPEKDIRHLISNAGSTFVVTDTTALSKVKHILCEGCEIKELFVIGEESQDGVSPLCSLLTEEECDDISDNNPEFDARQVPLSLVYTSGTTGVPKGVIQHHYSFSYTVMMMCRDILDVSCRDVTVMLWSLFHLGGQNAMTEFMNLGMKLVLIPSDLDFPNVVRTLAKYKPTLLSTSPTIVIKLATNALVSQHDLSYIHCLMHAGAPVRPPILNRLRRKLTNIKFICQGYGSSEAMSITYSTPEISKKKLASAGILTAGTLGKIIDTATGCELGPEKKGELYVKTPCQMLHYMKDPKKTAETVDNEGWIHTGDIAYYDEEGCIYVEDRVKDIIMFKGQRIYPSEVDSALLQNLEIDDVATIGVAREGFGEVPYCFLVRSCGQTITEEKLRKTLKESGSFIFDFTVVFEFVDQIPRNPTGKLLLTQLHQWAEKRMICRTVMPALTLYTT